MIGMRSGAVLLVVGLAGCHPPLKLATDDSATVLAHHRLAAPDPSQPGEYGIGRLFYGSGTDRRRPEYRDSVAFRTAAVDASKLVDLRTTAKSRKKYWGFGPDSFPVNARVWYPEGEGRFPLVLIVHGNHDMKDFSDPGYEYLGTLLASRGYIFASVDMNFLNGAISGENDARGWMLLKHLDAWRGFDADPENPFHGRVDMDRISLIGHSRGGEAVGHAAAFNRLRHYPDDGNVRFDFGHGIRSLIAIAPVDGQYRPAEQLVPVEDVSYLVFHGSHDGDVSSFMGLRQYQRVHLPAGSEHFKSAVFVYRANHGQWNTGWGAHDSGRRSARILDLRGLMPAEDQRRFAEVYISAFLEATLREDARYLPLFRDHRLAAGWLPRTMYITRFEEAGFRPLANFEEDVDLTTGSVPGVTIRGDSLATWREARLMLRAGTGDGAAMQNQAVWLGWNNRIAGEDTTRLGPPAVYALELSAAQSRELDLDRDGWLQFLLMPTEVLPGPRKAPKVEPDSAAAEQAADSAAAPARPSRPRPPPKPKKKPEPPPVDLSIEVVDADGVSARVALSRYGAIRRPLALNVARRRDMESRWGARLETVLQSFTIPLEDFAAASPALDLGRLREVRFVFDRAVAGTVIVDDIGFSAMRPGFRGAPTAVE
jgi:dienelactone hydrolase